MPNFSKNIQLMQGSIGRKKAFFQKKGITPEKGTSSKKGTFPKMAML